MTGTPHPRWRPAAVLVVLLALTSGTAAAQAEEETIEPAPIAAEKPAATLGTAERLGDVQSVRNDANAAGQASQQRIDTLSDETETLFSRYSAALKQIDSLRVFNRQMRELIVE